MRELKGCKLYFYNFNSVYHPGEAFTAFLEIDIKSTKVIKGIFFEVLGSSIINCSEKQLAIKSISRQTSNLSKLSIPVEFRNKEDYLHHKLYVLGNGVDIIDLPPGEYIYPFRYRLPVYLLPTLSESSDHVSYSIRATLELVNKPNKFIEAPFIIQSLPFIDEPNAKKPGVLRLEKKFKELPNSKPLKAVVKIAHLGVSPGQSVLMTLDVNNESEATVNYVSIQLRQLLRFHTITKEVKLKIVIAKDDLDFEVDPGMYNTIYHTIKVPANLTLFDLTYCEIVDVDYDIKVEFHTPGFSDNLIGKMRLYPINHSLPFASVSR